MVPRCRSEPTWWLTCDSYGAWLEAVRAEARAAGESLPAKLPADMPLFNVPTGLIRILNRDLAAAGIPNRDDRGRTVDVHAMCHTFGTHLSKAGVSPRTAQAAMRHSNLDLTMNIYTDRRLFDVASALDVLPMLSLNDMPTTERTKATGTDPQTLVPTAGNQGAIGTTADMLDSNDVSNSNVVSVANDTVKASHDKTCQKAGDGIRTHDIHVGNVTLYH